nr:hypothetical protein [uncultured Rhodoferax sp.]
MQNASEQRQSHQSGTDKVDPATDRAARPLTVGDYVNRGCMRLKIGKISKRGVVTLNHTCGGFAMYSHLAVLVRA